MRFICYSVLLFVFCPQVSSVRGALVLKKSHQLSMESDDNDEEREEEEEEDYQADVDKSRIYEQGETRDFLQFLGKIKYDHRQCPDDEKGGPVLVNVSIVVSNIRSVSEVTMDYSLEMFYRESWRDPRLKYSKRKFKNKTEISLHESYSNFLWHPDTFVPNAIASKNPRKQSITHRSLLRLRNDGSILYSRRLSLVVTCGMDLTLFPFDSQLCKLGIESYGYTADQVQYMWSHGQITALTLHKIRLPDFQIKEAYVTSRVESYATGDYSRLYVCFVFSRAAGFCFLQLIIPSTAVVITSWVSLWMENETSFQDMISIILTITFLLFSYNEVMPRVSYIKAMDVYLGVCFCIVFCSLIKLAIVKYMRQRLRLTSGHSTNFLKRRLLDVSILHIGGFYFGDMPPPMPSPPPPISRKASQITELRFIDESDTSIVAGMMPMLRVANGVSTPSPITNSQTFTYDHHGITKKLNLNEGIYTAVHMDKNGSTLTVDERKRNFIEFTPQFMHRFHWITQMTFFFGFVLFCLFYFLVYPNIHTQLIDEDCVREAAEWFADIR